MEFFFGGKYNGKLKYVLKKYNTSEYFDIKKDDINNITSFRVVNNLDEIIAYAIENNLEYDEIISSIESNQVLIGNIITNGVVPIDSVHRLLRDTVGFAYQKVVKKADEVYKIIYGIEVKIK